MRSRREAIRPTDQNDDRSQEDGNTNGPVEALQLDILRATVRTLNLLNPRTNPRTLNLLNPDS